MQKPWAAGFTVVEILIVIVVMGILATIVYNSFGGSNEKTYLNRANVEFNTMANALKLYVAQHNEYPPDENRGIPAGIQEFIADTDQNTEWPAGPWPGSVYDYDNWTIEDSGGEDVQTYQISIRFCPAGAADTSQCKFPKQDWAADFNVDSAVYYCIQGLCRSHQNQPATYPGYCVNCPGNKAIGT